MNPTHKHDFSTNQNDNSTLLQPNEIPIKPPSSSDAAAAKIQAAYKSHLIRKLIKKISAVKSETDRLEELIQRQETVDKVRSNEKERMRMNEALMGQLLKLDSVPGFDHGVKELRRSVSRRIVELQEVMDGICGVRIMDGCDGWSWDDEMMCPIQDQVCVERGGGGGLEEFCAYNLGFPCFQRFLRQG